MTTFSQTFYDCDNITEVPEGLFANCPDVTSFNSTFDSCSNLIVIPVNIFDNNRKVVDFYECFNGCSRLEGESPYTEIGGIRYHLYERKNNAEQFITPTSMYQAFRHCSNLTDYSNIPTDWK